MQKHFLFMCLKITGNSKKILIMSCFIPITTLYLFQKILINRGQWNTFLANYIHKYFSSKGCSLGKSKLDVWIVVNIPTPSQIQIQSWLQAEKNDVDVNCNSEL